MIIETKDAADSAAAVDLVSIKDAARTVIQEMANEHKAKLKELEKRVYDAETKAARPPMPAPYDNGGTYGGGETSGRAELTEEGKAFTGWVRTGEVERKAMSGVNDPNGGYLLSPQMDSRINSIAATMGAIRRVARVVPAQNADFIQVIATSFAGTEWLAETGTRSTTATPALARVRPPSGGLSAVAPISNWLLNDSMYDAAAFVEESIGQGIGLAESAAFITGDTINKPSGILTQTIAAGADSSRPFGTLEEIVSGSAATLDVDSLISLLYALAPQYRARAAFVMNPSTVALVRKLKASTSGDYVWSPSAAAGQPATLLGVPCLEDVNMPVVAANVHAVLCGDFFAGYTIIDIGNTMLLRDPFTSKGNTLVYVEKRIGGAVTDSNAIKVLKVAAP